MVGGEIDLMGIQRRIFGNEQPLNLMKQDRKFLGEAQFLCEKHKKLFLLFDDLLIVGKPSKNNQIKFIAKFPIEVIQFEDVKNDKTQFIIKTPSELFKITSKAEEKKHWISLLEKCKNNSKPNRTIGVDITTILNREENPNGIPSIVTQCISHIKSIPAGIESEGIFRISGEARQIETLKEIFDNCISPLSLFL